MKREDLIKHWDVIEAFKEGKTIYSNEYYEDRYVVDENPHFYIDSRRQTEYIAVEKNQYIINEYSDDKKQWFEENKCPNGLSKIYHRIRICGKTKRLPTIKEVQRWFFTNKVFKIKGQNCYQRIISIDKDIKDKLILIGLQKTYSIKEFCELYTNLDGTELYVTEEKLTYGGEIADFPIEIVERMLECQVEQGNKRDVSVFERNRKADKKIGGFSWYQTKEGPIFWVDVIDYKKFSLFFKKYHKK